MRKLLWIGDAVAATGFARATHKTLEVLKETWEVHVLGINYRGDPHDYPYKIYPCWPGGDAFGIGRTAPLATQIKPDLVVVQNDPWNVPKYLEKAGNVPVVATMPVDGKNCRGAGLNGLAGAIFWTEFGRKEAELGGYRGQSAVIPLGVDLDVYSPGDKAEACRQLRLPDEVARGFVVGNVNRNQPRKRLDLFVSYFAEWIRTRGIPDAFMFLYVAPTGDAGYDINQLAHYYRLASRIIHVEPPIGSGNPENVLARCYQTFDCQATTTQGEGWGLCTMEGMACGVPQIIPDWSALGEWVTDDAALKISCPEICVTPNNVNAVGGVPDRAQFLDALDRLYADKDLRQQIGQRGLALVSQDQYRWENVGKRFAEALDGFINIPR